MRFSAIGVQYIELARGLTWDELNMDAVEGGDARVVANQLLASAADLPANEDLAVDAALGLIDSKFTEVVDDSTFTVWQYVTLINPEIKRVVVFVEWENRGSPRVHHVSTVMAENRKWSTP